MENKKQINNDKKILNQLQNDFINENFPLGMLGVYFEKELPIYCINDKMLQYLGYDSEKEYISDTDGKFINSISGLTFDEISYNIYSSMKNADTYKIEYQIRRRNQEFIWIREQGKITDGLNGKKLLLSVCCDITEELEIKHIQERQLNFLDTLYNSVPCGIVQFTFEKNPRLISFNKECINIFGLENDSDILDNMGDNIFKIIYHEDREKINLCVQRVLNGEKNVYFQYRFLCLNGRTGAVGGTLSKSTSADGCPILQSVFLDIRERIEYENTVNEHWARLHREFEYCDRIDKTFISSYYFNITKNTVIDVHSRIFGNNITEIYYDELLNHAVQLIYDDDERADFLKFSSRENLCKVFYSDSPHLSFEYRRYISDDCGTKEKIIWVSASISLMREPESGDIIAFAYIRDINNEKIKRIVTECVVSQDYDCICYIDIVLGDFMTFVNKNKSVVDFSCEYTDYNDAITKFARTAISYEESQLIINELALENITRLLDSADSEYVHFFYNIQNPSGVIYRIKVSCSYLDRVKKLMLLTLCDVTAIYKKEIKTRLRIETSLAEAEKANRVKNEFMTRISNEMRIPMNTIVGMSELCEKNLRDTALISDGISKIRLSADHMISLIGDILDLRNMQNGAMVLRDEIIPFAEFLRSINIAAKNMALEKEITYSCNITGTFADYYSGDSLRLRQMLMSLLSNAVKFTSKGGIVQLNVKIVSASSGKSVIRFIVSDNGIGIGEQFLPKIFEPFEQEQREISLDDNLDDNLHMSSNYSCSWNGIGLGLAVCHNIVNRMNGNIHVESKIGIGSIFTVEIPLLISLGAIEPIKSTYVRKRQLNCLNDNVKYDFSGRRVLLVEDHELNMEIAKKLLERKLMAVDTAHNGLEALSKFESSDIGQYDIILMDLHMPIMDGFTAAAKIRGLMREDSEVIPIIAITADAAESDIDISLKSNMNACLIKPLNPTVLYDTLKTYMR